MQDGDFVQIRSKLAAVACGNLQLARFGQGSVLDAFDVAAQNALEFTVGHFQRVECDEKRAIRGTQIADTRHGLRFEQQEQSAHALMRLKRDFLSKVDQERLIARGLESHGVSLRRGHFAQSI